MAIESVYTGTWTLIPELCLYQSGEPPASGSYVINRNNDAIDFQIDWQDQAGEKFSIQFGGRLDGVKHKADSPGVTTVKYEHIDPFTLDSTAYDGEAVTLYARRVASRRGDLLAVLQESHVDGQKFTNFQVYRRFDKASPV